MTRFRNPWLILTIAFCTLVYSFASAQADMIQSISGVDGNSNRAQKIETIRRALENKLVRQKLKDAGLNTQDVDQQLATMNDEQIHTLAHASQDVLAGGDGGALELVITLLIIAVLVILILKLMGKDISIGS